MKNVQQKALSILGLKLPFTLSELKLNYRQAMLSNHPDRGGSTAETVEINAAFKSLRPLAKSEQEIAEEERVAKAWLDERHARNEGHPLHTNRLPALKSFASMLKDNFYMLDRPGTADDLHDSTSSIHYHGFYYQEGDKDYHISCGYGNWNSFRMFDVTHGGRVGKTVRSVQFVARKSEDNYDRDIFISNVLYKLTGEHETSLTSLFESLHEAANANFIPGSEEKVEFEFLNHKVKVWSCRYDEEPTGNIYVDGELISFTFETDKSKGHINPYTLHDALKPLKTLPERPTVTHILRILAHGQFSNFKQNYYLTDDHAMDAAYDFRNGYIENPLFVLKQWFGKVKRSCGHIYTDKNGNLHFGSHSNDSMTLTFVEGNRHLEVDLDNEVEQIEEIIRTSNMLLLESA
ncbi:J domain-containing protein [Vibrio parahaemolyticus]|nr:J domain-containing protein [Vibrio parahaemolyticus]